ncbi:ABC transporter permease [Luedemannella flava]|uniref:ABC transporter permease n=1 Tax=Luedemannella flava TaxID=349316 RepID=UPI0031DE6D30
MSAVWAAARAAVTRRRVQTVIIGMVVLFTSATGVLAVGLAAASHGPFDKAFAAAQGAHVAANISAKVPADQVARTATASGVTAAAGPFDTVNAGVDGPGGVHRSDGLIVGRSEAGGAIDKLSLDEGSWLTGPGQIVMSRRYAGPRGNVGDTVTVGTVSLKVVGIGTSATGTGDAWVWPTQTDVLTGAGLARQMLYRFAAHDTDAQLRDALATATAGLPAGSVESSTSYLTVRTATNRAISAFVPFVVAFAVLGIILSVLITANVVSGAVVAGYRTIGVLKTVGFTPAHVVAAYVVQVVTPAVVGAAIGVPLGIAVAQPLLAKTDRVYDVASGQGGVPVWAIVTVLLAAPALVAVSAIGPALRAGRLAANQAISVGRAPRLGRGFRARRALTASPLPRPVALGLGLPLARPSRAAGTVVAILLGATTLVFAVGLAASVLRVDSAFTRRDAVQITADVLPAGGPVRTIEGQGQSVPEGGPGGPPGITDPTDPAVVLSAVRAMDGTAHATIARLGLVKATGIAQEIDLSGYVGDARWTGWPIVSGRWYSGAGEVVVSSYFLRTTGHQVGDQLTFEGDHVVTIVGEVLAGTGNLFVVGDATLVDKPEHTVVEIGLTDGTDAGAYAAALQEQYPDSRGVIVEDRSSDFDSETFIVLEALIATLALLLSSVAALGVLNTVVLTTRERVQEIGVLKALGMTPRQTRTMVITSMVGLGLVGGVIAVPAGVALHHWIVPIMGEGAGTPLPDSVLAVYGVPQLLLLGCAGIVLAVLGALLPAGWAARTRVATALRAE